MAKHSIKAAGVDVSKDKLDIAIHGPAETGTVPNDAGGWQSLASHFKKACVTIVGLEATGGYERGVLRHLQQAGFTVKRFQPLQIRAFAALHLQRAKTDRIDAILIAACTQVFGADCKLPADARFDRLADHLTFIEQQEEDIARLKTRLEYIRDKRVRKMFDSDIKRLQRRRSSEMARVQTALRSHADLAERFDLVQTVPTIGQRTALALVVRMPELGQVSREAAAALAGLAPFVHQSGKYKGETHIGGGRSRLRKSLYAAALPGAFRWNKALMAQYQRLTGRGKSHNAALIACTRTLLIMANAVVARGTPWQERAATG